MPGLRVLRSEDDWVIADSTGAGYSLRAGVNELSVDWGAVIYLSAKWGWCDLLVDAVNRLPQLAQVMGDVMGMWKALHPASQHLTVRTGWNTVTVCQWKDRRQNWPMKSLESDHVTCFSSHHRALESLREGQLLFHVLKDAWWVPARVVEELRDTFELEICWRDKMVPTLVTLSDTIIGGYWALGTRDKSSTTKAESDSTTKFQLLNLIFALAVYVVAKYY